MYPNVTYIVDYYRMLNEMNKYFLIINMKPPLCYL